MLSAAIKAEALRLGFADCGFSKAGPLKEDSERLQYWIDEGLHAKMGYMANHIEKRTDPTLLVEGARSVISVLYNYNTDKRREDPEAPILSKYAYGKDYHFVMKEKLRQLFNFLQENFGPVTGRIFVDSAPVLDRAWARKAGLGWIGKNSNLISRKYGSFLFIGEIICDQELVYNEAPESDFCGSCNRCIEACPTDAILSNRTLDARRCISYQTIENKDEIDTDIRAGLSNRLFGCDICQDVCPWNRKAIPHSEPAFEPSGEILTMSREEWLNLTEEKFKGLFKDSPVKRAGYEKLMDTLRSIKED
jgi:epoxyqueuosine reductase